jgi:hypothetical protein
MPEDPETMPKRQQLIQIAKKQAGSHYLKGAMGQIPGAGGLELLANNVDAPTNEQHFFTAKNSHNKCSGRHGKFNDKNRPIGDPRNPLHLAHPEGYCWYRVVTWKDENKIYGESCKDKVHFDCSGFVNWCLMKVSRTFGTKRLLISEIRSLCEAVCTTGVKHDDLCVGDILIRRNDHHHGFALGEATNQVVQAEWESTGVVIGSVGHWQFHGRLPKSYWVY